MRMIPVLMLWRVLPACGGSKDNKPGVYIERCQQASRRDRQEANVPESEASGHLQLPRYRTVLTTGAFDGPAGGAP